MDEGAVPVICEAAMRRAMLVAVALCCLALSLSALTAAHAKTPETAQIICVKYGPCPLDVSTFACTDTPRSSFIRRVCYDAPRSFMAIKLKETRYPYCEIDAATVQQLLSAGLAGTFYNENIRSRPDGAHGPFDCRDHPQPKYP